MKIVYVEPNKSPIALDIENDLAVYQGLVEGFIEVVYPFTDNAVLVCNEEGKCIGLPFNRYLRYNNGEPYDALMGSFFIVGDDGLGDFCSLTDEQIDKYITMFETPDDDTSPNLKDPLVNVTSFDTIDDLLKILYFS